MAYDENPSDNVRVEVAFATSPDDPDPAWVDLTSRLDLKAGVNITRGREDEFAVIQPSTCSLTLDNNDGELTAGNAGSSFYPNVLPHRKIRVSYRDPAQSGNFVDSATATVTAAGIANYTSNTAFGSLTTAQSWVSEGTHPAFGTTNGLVTWPTTAIGSGVWATVGGLVIGRTYRASVTVWVPTGSPDVRLTAILVVNGASTSVKDAFVRITCTFTATQTSHAIGVTCASATAGQVCYWDGLRVDEAINTPTGFTSAVPPIKYRFTGYVDEWPVEWPGGGRYSHAQITAVDRLARIGAKRRMRSVIEEAVLSSGPFGYWPLGEPEGAVAGGEVAGVAGHAPLTILQFGGVGGTLTFGTATGPPTDDMPAPTFTPVSPTSGLYLESRLQNLGTKGSAGWIFDVSLGATFLTNVVAEQTIVRLTEGFGGYLELRIDSSGRLVAELVSAFSGSLLQIQTAATTFANGATHHAVVNLKMSGTTMTMELYINGSLLTFTMLGNTSMPLFKVLNVGGSSKGRCFNGTISHVALFAKALSNTEVADQHTAMTTGFEGERSDQRIARYATWSGADVSELVLDVGSSDSIAFVDTTGQSLAQAMQDIGLTESGRLFVNGAGKIVFHSRARGYSNAAAVATVRAEQLGSDSRFISSTQGMVNEMTGQRPDGPPVRAFDAASVEAYGVLSQQLTLLVTSDREVADAVNWRVQGYKAPMVRMANASFDVYTETNGSQDQFLALELGDRVTVTDLPAQAPAASFDLVLEGYTETIALSSWTIAANLSNYSAVQALVLDDNVYGLLDDDNRLIY